jgi:hypothetical protein
MGGFAIGAADLGDELLTGNADALELTALADGVLPGAH